MHPSCINVNQQELCAFETYDIPFMCSRCEWEVNYTNDVNNIECDVFNGSDKYSIIGIDADTQKY